MADRIMEDADELEHVLGLALAEGLAPVELPKGQRVRLRDRVLSRARAGTNTGLRTVRASDGGWVATSALTEMRALRHETSATHHTIMFRLKASGEIPAHSHRFEEETFVLEGEIEVGQDLMRAGDYQLAVPGSSHDTIRSRDGAVLLIRYQTDQVSRP